jgi:hypothetical protein
MRGSEGATVVTVCIYLLLYNTKLYKTHHYLFYIQIQGEERKINE